MWKQIENYEYEVNEKGEIRNIKNKHIISQQNHKNGYKVVMLYDEGKAIKRRVHRLVAEAFLDKKEYKKMEYEIEYIPYDMLEVNHKDLDKANNDVNNLEWCTRAYNIEHAYRNIEKIPRKVEIISIDVNNLERKEYKSIYEACKDISISKKEQGIEKEYIGILRSLKSKTSAKSKYKGMVWFYKEETEENIKKALYINRLKGMTKKELVNELLNIQYNVQ